MKPRKHKHKESFSILLISNTGQNTKHFHVSRVFLRLFTVLILCVCAAVGWVIYDYMTLNDITGGYVNASEDSTGDTELLEQVAAQEKLIQQLEEERDALNRQNDELTSENKALLEAAKLSKNAAATDDTGDGGDSEDDPAFPSRYPYSATGEVSEKYSDDHPYITIVTQGEGDVVAAGSGTISIVGSDDTYQLIIEIEHGNGYRTRYMLPENAESLLEEGTQVQAGTALVPIDIHNEQLDYQVIYEDEPMDPLIVFEAKG